MANEIVWFDSSETGAPVLNNAAGALDSVLHACLVTGFLTQNLTGVTVSGGVATATLAGHGYSDKRMVDIAGATPAGLNGRKLITVTGSGTFTFPAPGVADGAATGTVVAKRSPLGWTRPRNSGNVSIYERSDPAATTMALRVDDTGSTAARWLMVESHTSLASYTNPTPPASQFDGAGVYLPKGADSSTAKKWVLVGDSRTFYLFTESSGYSAGSYAGVPQGIWAFGDIEPYRSGDAYACIVAGAQGASSVDSQGLGSVAAVMTTPSSFQVMLPRPFNGVGSPVRAGMAGVSGAGGSSRRLGGAGPAYPSPVDNGVVLQAPVLLCEDNSAFFAPFRGHLRGMADPLAVIPGGQLHLQTLDTVVGSDRRWLLVGFNQQGSYGHVAFDITGPW